MTVTILHGDCRDVLKTLPSDHFDCICTSPPYFGLRSYLPDGHADKAREIGLEPTLDGYIAEMVGVFDELRRVLKPSGTAWLNLGDSYAANGSSGLNVSKPSATFHGGKADARQRSKKEVPAGLKPKDLCGVPWRVAFALQARGWWLRSGIVWNKPNPMPESVSDRPTSSYEMLFLLTKSERYFFDADAIAEEAISDHKNGNGYSRPEQLSKGGRGQAQGWNDIGGTRNARNVWTIASQPFKGSHFATMPPDLAERCIKAGCPIGGHVLDPFGGAGTTGLVADRLWRNATLIELNPSYGAMAGARIADDSPLFAQVAAQ